MEPIIIKKGKKEYTFYSDKLVITKGSNVIRSIRHDEISEITYNPKFGINDLIGVLIPLPGSGREFPNAFVIHLRPKGFVNMKLSNDEFERIKHTFKMPIELV